MIANIAFFTHTMFFWVFKLTPTVMVIPLLIQVTFATLHLDSHNICFVNVFHYFIPVIIFKFSVLFGTYSLLDRLLRVLQLPMHLSKLIPMGAT